MYYIAFSEQHTYYSLKPFATAQEAIAFAQEGGASYATHGWKLLKEVPIVADEDPVYTWKADQWSEKDLKAMENQNHPAIKMLKKAPCEICGKPVIPCEGEITMCNDCQDSPWEPKAGDRVKLANLPTGQIDDEWNPLWGGKHGKTGGTLTRVYHKGGPMVVDWDTGQTNNAYTPEHLRPICLVQNVNATPENQAGDGKVTWLPKGG